MGSDLGQILKYKKLIIQDLLCAWYRCALESDKGDTGRVRRLEVDIAAGVQKSISLLLDKLSPAQFAEGARLAKEYIARYSKLRANKPWL